MPDTNWTDLRPLNGSQHTAFEELCCQLARYEKVPPGATFVRKGAPDSGIEYYWKLPNGDEWGWQAKFFLSPPGATQWRQLDDSIEKALEKHPQLTSYTICLPIDRADPRIKKQKWFMDKWNEHIEVWQGWTRNKKVSVEFLYWGEHEILERLSREEHRGRYFFWFNKELFSQQWFENHINEAVANVGPRYTPELNVELPIARLFDGLAHTPEFYNRIKRLYGEIKRASSGVRLSKVKELAKDEFSLLSENRKHLLLVVESIETIEISPIDWVSIDRLSTKTREIAWEIIQLLDVTAEKAKKESHSTKVYGPSNEQVEINNAQYSLHKLITHLRGLQELVQSSETLLSNTPALLVTGKAGMGKTHLLCDVAKQRVRSGLPTVLLLGEHFNNEEPWSQIIKQLGLSCNRNEFLGALEAAAQTRGGKTLILIDALNEGEGRNLWNKHLAGMLSILSRYPWVAIAFSVRTSYENIIIPEGLLPEKLIREEHYGFADHEYQATHTFFSHYGIEHPGVPLLAPEFQNPLFLTLFCQGLKNLGLTKVPHGIQGITAVFKFFIESIDKKLSKPEYLDFDPKSQPVQKAVEKLAGMMADKGGIWLPREETQVAVNEVLPRDGYEKSLFRHMISEGLLTEDRFWIEDNKRNEGVHFSYERFTDHLITKHLFHKHLDITDPAQSFMPDKPLGALVKDERTCWRNRGLIEAFTIQLPEQAKKELGKVAPHCADFQPVIDAFIESLIWRDPKAFDEETRNYINKHVTKYEESYNQFLNVLLTVASYPNHPYNADFLHKHLMKFDLAERDAWWSIFLSSQHGTHGAVDRLVAWSWSPEDKTHIDDESIRLCGIALSWFLTSSNRYLRDGATKALVSLLMNRIHILRQIISNFLNVNDPYVLERLFAVAYGCAMRSTDNTAIGKLAKDIYDWIFKNGEPPPHILLRDYARGVIELALSRGVKLDINIGKVRPPYKSEWPSDIPTEQELRKYNEWQESVDNQPVEERAQRFLYNSVMNDILKDFAAHVIDHCFFEWSSQRLGEPRKPSRKEVYETFVQSLTKRQKKAWEFYSNVRQIVDFCARAGKEHMIEVLGREYGGEEFLETVVTAEQHLRKTLGKRKLKIFEEHVLPYLDNPHCDEYLFDTSVAKRWILKKVFDLGWTMAHFGWFDWNIIRYPRYGDDGKTPERMGKKYQWIAYHEFLARLSDNFKLRGDARGSHSEKYEGPWQIGYTRDIDPSCLLRKAGDKAFAPHTNTWWFTPSYNSWDSEHDDTAWLKSYKDLPSIQSLIEVTNPKDNSQWLVMEGYYWWEEPAPPEEERFEKSRRDIWYMLRSYIVKKSEGDEIFKWANQRDDRSGGMPESGHLTRVFIGEFFCSPAYRHYCKPSHSYAVWTRGDDNCIPKEVLVTSESYYWEFGTEDCSIEETIKIHLPCEWLIKQLGLRWTGKEGYLFNDKGTLVAFDPSVDTAGPGALLINRDVFLKFLDDNGYDILWLIRGEKGIIGGGVSPGDFKGRLEINGASRIQADKLICEIQREFSSPVNRDKILKDMQ